MYCNELGSWACIGVETIFFSGGGGGGGGHKPYWYLRDTVNGVCDWLLVNSQPASKSVYIVHGRAPSHAKCKALE